MLNEVIKVGPQSNKTGFLPRARRNTGVYTPEKRPCERPCEDTTRKHLSASRGEGPHQKPTLLAS